MRILIATEILAREDFIPCSFIFPFITQLLSLWSWEFAAIYIYAQAMFWVLIAAVFNPFSNPYIPKRKLSACSLWHQSWLKITNTAFDGLAIFIAPTWIGRRRRSCAGSFSSTSTAFPRRQRARPSNHATAIVFSAVTMGVIPLTSWLMGSYS
jgi:hypothetical protein